MGKISINSLGTLSCFFFQWFFYFFLFIIPWQTSLIVRQKTIGMQGLHFEGPWEYGKLALTALDIMFACVVVSGAVWILTTYNVQRTTYIKELMSDWINRCVLIFALLAWTSIFWSEDTHLAVLSAFRLTEGICIYGIARYARYDPIKVSIAFVAAASIQGILAWWQFFTQEVSANKWLGMAYHSSQQLGDVVVENMEVRWLRAYGSFPHPNMLGLFLVVGIFFTFYLAENTYRKRTWWMLFFSNLAMSAGLFFTFSRSLFISCAMALLIGGMTYVFRKKIKNVEEKKQTRRFTPQSILFIFSVLLFMALSVAFVEPLAARFGIGGWSRLEQTSTQERVRYTKDAFNLIRSSWLGGVGVGQYTREVFAYDMKENFLRPWYLYQPVHNVFLLVFTELGIVGLLLFLAISIGGLIVKCIQYMHVQGGYLGISRIAVGIVFISISVACVDHFFWTLQSGIILWWLGYGLFLRDSQKTHS